MPINRVLEGGRMISKISTSGFTLVEILIAISILAIIGTVTVPNLRQFNENQILQNTTNDIVRVLRQAQSSASSHTQCTSTFIARNWAVEVSSTDYLLETNCYNPSTNATHTDGIYAPTPAQVNGIALSARTSPSNASCSSFVISFSAEYMPYDQNRF